MGMSKSMSVAFKLVVGRCSEGGRVVLDEFDHVEAVVVTNWAAVGFSGNVASLWDATMDWGVVVLISCRLYGLGFNGCKLGRGGTSGKMEIVFFAPMNCVVHNGQEIQNGAEFAKNGA